MQVLYRSVYAASKLGAFMACLALVYMVGHILLEIVLRGAFSRSTFVVDEFVGLAVAGCVVWSLGYVVENGALIRVSAVTEQLPELLQRWLMILSSFTACGVALFLCHFFWLRLARDYSRGMVSGSIAQIPTWVPHAILFAGFVIFALQLAALGLRLLTRHPSPARPIEQTLPVE